jgi:hypothetical protein
VAAAAHSWRRWPPSNRRAASLVVVAVATAALLTTAIAAGTVPDLPRGCKTGYDYAGLTQPSVASGIRTLLTNMGSPGVGEGGHVAGWVGVGGPGLGPNGTDEWVQAGYAGFPGGSSQIYYEVTQPNRAPKYHTVDESVSPNSKNLVSVAEVKPNGWQVSVDDKAVSPVIMLPGSSGKFVPQALGETWNGNTTICNIYAYGFGNVQVTTKPGSAWVLGKAGYKYQNKQQLLITTAVNSFLARSHAGSTARTTSGERAAAATSEPPLIGGIVSSMLGHNLTTRCVDQSQAVTAQPATVLVSNRICEIMIGYAVAEPRVPAAYSPGALEMAQASLDFLRGIARASGTVFPDVDCGALTRFYTALKPLGATSAQAKALRKYLLHASIPLYLPHCPVH